MVKIQFMYLSRQITSRLVDLVGVFPVVVLVGARQVGKSTSLQEGLGPRMEIVAFTR